MDEHQPNCGCEAHSLRDSNFQPIDSHEMIARVLTSPDSIDLATNEVLRGRLTATYSSGVSVIRQGASDAEIALTVKQLTEGAIESRRLFGAAILRVDEVRSIGGEERWFCVYDTMEEHKTHHADIVGTFLKGVSKSKSDRTQSARRKVLGQILEAHLFTASTTDDLIRTFRRECT